MHEAKPLSTRLRIHHNETTVAATNVFSGLLMRQNAFAVGAPLRAPLGELRPLQHFPRPSSWCSPTVSHSSPVFGRWPRISALRTLRVHPRTNSWLHFWNQKMSLLACGAPIRPNVLNMPKSASAYKAVGSKNYNEWSKMQ